LISALRSTRRKWNRHSNLRSKSLIPFLYSVEITTEISLRSWGLRQLLPTPPPLWQPPSYDNRVLPLTEKGRISGLRKSRSRSIATAPYPPLRVGTGGVRGRI
jgi:hypothetical protein